MSNYPIEITKEEFEKETGIDLDMHFENPNIESDKFLRDVNFYTYEGALYSAGQKHIVNKIIAKFREILEPQIKAVLIKVAEYMLDNLDDNLPLYNGMNALEGGGIEIKDTQEIIDKILPPNIMTYVMNIQPLLVYAGGYRNV